MSVSRSIAAMPATAHARFKIFGERNCSTNALRQLIEMNSAARVAPSVAADFSGAVPLAMRGLTRLAGQRGAGRKALRERLADALFARTGDLNAWKHCLTDFPDTAPFRDTLVIFCVRHPASWLLALHRRPHHARAPVPERFEDFLAMGWPTVGRERMGGRTLTPPALYQAKVAAYLDFAARLEADGIACRTLRFEAFAADQIAQFAALAPDLAAPAAAPVPITRGTKDPERSAAYYRDYYGQERWREDLSPEATEVLRNTLDWDLFARVGYGPL